MHNILFCFAEKDVKNIIFPSADDVYEMLEPFGVDYLVDVKLEEEYLEDFIEYFSRFGRISYQKK
jgi:hypothetical protein